jgi:hypothetical protein
MIGLLIFSLANHLRRGVAWDLISRKSEGRLVTELMGHCCTPLVTTFSILQFLKKKIRLFSSRGYDKVYREGKKVLLNLIDIPVPVSA